MKTIITLLSFISFLNLNATDRVVQESGPLGTYSSITAAVTAASSGDRIVISNRIGNIPWMENVVINKSLEFINSVADTFFIVQGNYDVVLTTPGTVTIIGMKNISGNVGATADAPAGARTVVNLFASYLSAGSVVFNFNNYDCRISGNYINGTVNYRFGRVIANYGVSQSNLITINSDATATNDTIFIIANVGFGRINGGSSSQFFYIANNAITNSTVGYGISVSPTKNSALSENIILNNSISCGNGSGINVALAANAKVNVFNNVVQANTNAFNLGGGSSINMNVSYNGMLGSGGFTGGLVNNGTNFNLGSGTYTWSCSPTVVAVCTNQNNGHPDPIYSDLDLTRSELGPMGGSFTLSNFFNSTCSYFAGGKARVWFLMVPRHVIQGNTINIQADGYDR